MPSPHPTADTTLDWSAYVDDFRRAGHEVVDWIARYLEHTRDYPVLPRVKPGELTAALPHSAPERGESFETILKDFDRVIVPAVTHWNHPRFLAYFACSGSTPAILAEALSAALNTNGLSWKASPAIAELEPLALDWLRQWMGLPDDYIGIIYDTASVSTLHAIAAARDMADPEARTLGSRPIYTLYTSQESHASVEKGAIALGVGQNNVRKIPSDAEFRMRPDALVQAIEKDLADGKRPFCVVATVGTTSTTSVDPVAEIADIAEKYHLWLHIDAAYAGTAAILPECRHILNGAEHAHSLVVNCHKWLLTPVDLSAFYTRRPDILRRALSLVPDYLRESGQSPMNMTASDLGIPLGRRFRALKLWFLLRYFGRERIQEIVRSHIAWAKRFAEMIDRDPRFERAAPAPFSVVCFRYKGSDDDNKSIMDAVNAGGEAFISHTVLRGRVVLRLAIGNLGTTWADVERAWELIQNNIPNRSS
ncbi:MAG: pyridoxal phosphate-dependent decarboxylase family protein [Terriglobales bacterium]